MSSERMSAYRAALALAAAWWRGLAARERMLLVLAGSVLACYLVWAVAIAPAWRTLAQAPAELDALEGQYQTMQRLASEAKALRAAAPVNAEMAAAAMKSATARLGDQARLQQQGDRAVLTLSGVSSRSLRDWLAEVRSGARARPVEVNLTRGESGFSGSIVLAVGGTG